MIRIVPPWLPTLLGLTLIVGLTGRRWWQMGEFPTGLDGGQWLALGRGLAGPGRETAGAYAPLVPALAAAGAAGLGPSLALKLIAIGSFAAILMMLWLIARDGLGAWIGVSVLAIAGPASALTEPMAFGGYPQQLALAALVLAAWSLAHFLAGGGRAWLGGAVAGLGVAALSHHIYYPLTLGVAGVLAALWLARPPARAEVIRRGAVAAAVIGGSGLLFLPTALAFLHAAYAPPLAAAGLDRWAAWQYGTREAVIAWSVLAVTGVGGLIGAAPRAHRQPAWRVAIAILLTAGGLFLASAEARLLPPVLIALALGVGYGLNWLGAICSSGAGVSPRRLREIGLAAAPRTRSPSFLGTARTGRDPGPMSGRAPDHADEADQGTGTLTRSNSQGSVRRGAALAVLPALLALLVPLLLLRSADGEATAFFRYYRVLDQSLLDTAVAIESAAPAGLVAVRADARGWPVGWWLEGLTTAPIAVGSDRRWLGFPAERERADLVDALFSPSITGAELRERANAAGIELIVLRKREWIGWQRWLGTLNPPVTVLFDDGEYLVLRVRPD